ncbi:hyoscyamine 6-dioxygenase-like [Apium graveolens]|uniref:hyoscyamine 6-dioxygenase-like n=1 Tax=Apium graveolens TaxID=4045 RepID=UPI003D7B7AB4
MDKQTSSWFTVQNVPENYIFPEEDRPGSLPIPICDTIPVISLGKSTSTEKVQEIMEACRKFRLFHVTDHGVPEAVIIDTMKALQDFFELPEDERAKIPSEGGCVYTSSSRFAKDGVHLWRDCLKHPCHPLEQCIHFWPEKPTEYRDSIAKYVGEIRKMSLKILELISIGLGLKAWYLGEISEVQILTANNYPACPDPSLTLGLLRHCDPSLITILYQGDIRGLQIVKDGQWIGVEALPNAFVVILGNQLEIISNGKLRSTEHRAVTNPSEARRSIATLVNPSPNCIVEPAEVLVDDLNPSLYEPTLYKDFVLHSRGFGAFTKSIQSYIKSET